MVMEIKWNFNLPHPCTNFEIQRYYQNEPRFNRVHSRDNEPKKIKEGGYIISLNEYVDIGAHWITLYVAIIEITYFVSFGVEHVPKEIEKLIGHKKIETNTFRIHANSLIICGCFYIGFIDFMFPGKNLIDFTSLFSLYDFFKKWQYNLELF